MPIENIRFVVTGANPQTKTVQVTVDPVAGTGSASFVLSGSNSGTDNIQAFMDSQSLSSNTAQVNWQQSNGVLAIGPVTSNFYAGTGLNYTGLGAFTGGPYTGNSLVFNQVKGNAALGVAGFPITGFSTTDGNTGAASRIPMSQQQQSSTGAWVSDTYFSQATGGFNSNHQGSFVVTQAGSITLYLLVDDSWALFVGGGVTRVSGPFDTTVTSKAGLTQVGARMGGQAEIGTVDMLVLNFPSPGIYPFELGHGEVNASGGTNHTYIVVTYAPGVGITPTQAEGNYGQNILPIAAIQPIPPAPSAGTGPLLLTPTGGATNLAVQGTTVTLNLNLQNIKYTQKPYIPLFEGNVGQLYILDNGNAFTPPSFNGAPVDTGVVASEVLVLSGSNSSWVNRLSVIYNQFQTGPGVGEYFLYYNGSSFDPNVQSTQLTLTAKDIAWYDAANKEIDLFTPTSQGGGTSYEIEVDYFVQPVIASVTPSNGLIADGSTVQFLVSLAKPLHLQQSNIALSPVGGGGITVTSQVTNTNSSGQVTGWTLTATSPVASSVVVGTITLGAAATAPLTFLRNNAFVTESNISYFAGYVASITFSPAVNANLQNYAFLVTSNLGDASVNGFGSSSTLTCTVSSSASDFGALQFVIAAGLGSFGNLGSPVSPTNIRQSGSVYLADYSLTVNTSIYTHTSTYQFGYTTEDLAQTSALGYVDAHFFTSNN